MPDSNELDRTVAASRDQRPAGGSADETAAYSGHGPKFGPPTSAAEVGTLGPYRVLKELGKGGMGAVYLALDTRLDRKLALKVMLPEFAADRAAKERFLREARAAAKVSHDNVVTVYEADERDGAPYIAMQFLQGSPLDRYLKIRGAPALAHVIRIGRETALGLAAAHEMGLVHRDIKPANLWLEAPNGRIKVLDFGLAKPVGADAELTKSGAVMGTPAYMSPEQARGGKVDHRTDLFSLGAVLYRLCTGRMPFAGEHVMAVLAAVLTDDPPPVRDLNPSVPEPLAALIHQLLAKQPERRPPTANEVAKRLWAVPDERLAPDAATISSRHPAPAADRLPACGSKSNAKTVRSLVSVQYIVRPSGLQARPLLLATSSTMRSRLCGVRQYSEPLGRRSSWIVPTQKRPCGSALPSLKRSFFTSYGAGRMRWLSPVPTSKWNSPSRRAISTPPSGRGAMLHTSVGNDHAVCAAEAGTKRLSLWPAMSTQYSACSRGCQNGDSPAVEGGTGSGVNSNVDMGTPGRQGQRCRILTASLDETRGGLRYRRREADSESKR